MAMARDAVGVCRAVRVLFAVLAACAALLLPSTAAPGPYAVPAAATPSSSQPSHADPGGTWHEAQGVPPRACRPVRAERPALPTDAAPAPPCTTPRHVHPARAHAPAVPPTTAARRSPPDAGRAPPQPPGT